LLRCSIGIDSNPLLMHVKPFVALQHNCHLANFCPIKCPFFVPAIPPKPA
jgi:hypothetical protein